MSAEPGRESYHHGDLREALISAACAHLRRENADTLSLRALAREIGVSQTAPYRHFDSRNALFAAIAIRGFELLENQLRAAVAACRGDEMTVMVTLGQAYLEFAAEHREKYQLFFDSSLVDFDEYPELRSAGGQCFEILLEGIRRGRLKGAFRDAPEEELAGIIWAGLHGMASLLQMNRQSPGFHERAVGRAVDFLAEQQDTALRQLLQSIR